MDWKALTLSVSIQGDTVDDLELALEEVLKLVSSGMTSGFNGNETGNFKFNITSNEIEILRRVDRDDKPQE